MSERSGVIGAVSGMNWIRYRPWIGLVTRLLLGAVWIWAAVEKLGSPRRFVQAVRVYDATPEWLSKAIGYGLPVLELCLGVLLVVGIMVRISAIVSGLLFVVFLVGVLQAAARGLKLDCGCFGGGGTTAHTHYLLDVLRDLGLLIVAVYLVVWSMTQVSIEWYLARHDYVAPPSAKRMRTPEGRRRYETQLASSRATARSRTLYVDSSLAIIVVLVSVIGIGVQSNRAKIADLVTGKHASASNGVVFGKKAAATVDIYEDFGCPVCREFESDTHAKLEQDVRADLAQVRYHPISILDSSSKNQYSTRAANAAVCVSEQGVDQFVRFHDILFGDDSAGKQVQPEEGTAGPGDSKLTSLAKQAKLTSTQVTSVSDCILAKTYKPLVQAMTEKSSQRGVTGTPTIYVNGKKLADHTATTLFKAIAAADAKGPAPDPSTTPVTSSSAAGSASSSAPGSASGSASSPAASSSPAAPSASK